MDGSIRFGADGLVPAVVQDAGTGQVIMLAWMNALAVQKTLDSGETHFWSRSRQELWHKGATSGNTQQVVDMRLDCDGDSILLRVRPAGPACHTGETSCFFNPLSPGLAGEAEEDAKERPERPATAFSLQELYEVICERRDHPSAGSYTSSLFAKGEDEIVKKVGEEAIEVILAAKGQGDGRLVEETADLAYHLLVLLAGRGLAPSDILAELARRHKK